MPLMTLLLGVTGFLLVSAVSLLALFLICVEVAAAAERRRSPDPKPLHALG